MFAIQSSKHAQRVPITKKIRKRQKNGDWSTPESETCCCTYNSSSFRCLYTSGFKSVHSILLLALLRRSLVLRAFICNRGRSFTAIATKRRPGTLCTGDRSITTYTTHSLRIWVQTESSISYLAPFFCEHRPTNKKGKTRNYHFVPTNNNRLDEATTYSRRSLSFGTALYSIGGVDGVQAGSRSRRESLIDFVHIGFLLFPWFSSVGNVYEWSTLKLIHAAHCRVASTTTILWTVGGQKANKTIVRLRA